MLARRCLLSILATFVCSGIGGAQQRPALPHGTGSVAVPDSWTVLQAPDLTATHRPTDPQDEPARSLLLGLIADMQRRAAAAEHTLLHASGSTTGWVRVISAFADPRRATTEELASSENVTTLRQAIETADMLPGGTLAFIGHETLSWWPTRHVVLHFHLDCFGARWHLDHHVVPAGQFVQHFEVVRHADDGVADSAVETVIRSFDGAREPATDITRTLILGGISGAVAGMVTALVRRMLRDRAATRGALAQKRT